METEYKTLREAIKDLLKNSEMGIDMDAADMATEENLCAITCYIYPLTSEGEAYWKDVLDRPAFYDPDSTIPILIGTENDTGEQIDRIGDFLFSLAGNCSEKNFDKWFKD